MSLKEKLLLCNSPADYKQLILSGVFNNKECVMIDNAIEEDPCVNSSDFDRLWILLSEQSNYKS